MVLILPHRNETSIRQMELSAVLDRESDCLFNNMTSPELRRPKESASGNKVAGCANAKVNQCPAATRYVAEAGFSCGMTDHHAEKSCVGSRSIRLTLFHPSTYRGTHDELKAKI